MRLVVSFNAWVGYFGPNQLSKLCLATVVRIKLHRESLKKLAYGPSLAILTLWSSRENDRFGPEVGTPRWKLMANNCHERLVRRTTGLHTKSDMIAEPFGVPSFAYARHSLRLGVGGK